VETAIEATRLGAYDFVQKPISLARLLSIVSQALENSRSPEKPAAVATPAATEPIGSSAVMQVLRGKAEQAAQHDLPVLITGEKGTGRENLARFIHAQSRRDGAFVMLELQELGGPSTREYLLGGPESDSGAGAFASAGGGTLFIPEIQDVPEQTLVIIGQVLEAGHLVREESGQREKLDCRLIASGDEQLLEHARQSEALQNLYFRLNVLPLQMPPLRERLDDVPELVRFYAEWFPNHENLPYRSFSVSAQNRLRNHSWPGNIRELRNLIQRLLVLGGEGEVSANEVDEALRLNPVEATTGPSAHPEYFDLPLREAREKFERAYLIFKLRQCGGSVGKLSDAVGMERTHLYRKLRALGIDPKVAAAGGDAQ
jgi:DNA-binding NtrC family response regulator